ncbi:alpha/beta fold hydrolase [Cellulomonas sp. JZ18]|uniref:alpha/beta fold hydrolase n=1 Tax=Cellulomonas sp. JZ18 TaxID=2654191 RepID=UPI0012D40351|nr:alpha/beta hydrolase [Cellulomonas sp. JZ18]QGQ18114.1 alpha/beta fold hydrolase [Cellulomonas sp. JZ18]
MDVILVPGFWLDASSWDAVTPPLVAAGHRVHPVTLPGTEDGADLAAHAATGLRDWVDAVVAVVDGLEGPVVLVGHSGGGTVVHAVVDARPDRVARAVYVDSWPTGHGGVINDELPVVGHSVPLPAWEVFEDADLTDLDDALRERFRAVARPVPARVASDPQQLSDSPARYRVPVTVVACEFPSAELRQYLEGGAPMFAELATVEDVTYVDLPTGHWPQLTRPEDLGEVLRTEVDRTAS